MFAASSLTTRATGQRMNDDKKTIAAVKMLILRFTGRIDMPREEAEKMDVYEELEKILADHDANLDDKKKE